MNISYIYKYYHDKSTSGTAAKTLKELKSNMRKSILWLHSVWHRLSCESHLRCQRVLPPFHHPTLNVRQVELATPEPLSHLRPNVKPSSAEHA